MLAGIVYLFGYSAPVTVKATESKHSLEKISAQAPTCLESGKIEYWQCKTCGQAFGEEEGLNRVEKRGDMYRKGK